MAREFPLVEVTWIDAESADGWVKPAGFPTPQRCFTVGRIVGDFPDHIVVAGTVGDEVPTNETEYGEVIALPRGMIVKTRRLKG